MTGTRRIPVSCNRDCGAGCPLTAHVAGGRLQKITSSPFASPTMSGCLRGFRAGELLYSPDRLRRPLLRSGPRGSGSFREVEWPEALERVASGLTDVLEKHGAPSILHLGGSGSCRGALHHTGRLTERFLAGLGGFTASRGNFSSEAADFITPHLFGTRWTGLDPATLRDSRLILLWGANVADTRFGCELANHIRECRRRGTRVIALDPRRSRTAAALADEWLPVKPGSDAALMAAVLHVLISEDRVDRAFVRTYSSGFEALERLVLGAEDGVEKTPAWAEPLCGLERGRIVDLARRYAEARPAALLPGLSIQRTLGGEEAMRLAAALQVATGNTGRPGGSTGGVIWNRLPAPRCGRLTAPDRREGAAVPVYRWADAILEGPAGGWPADIRCIYNVGGNYLAQGSDIRKNIQALERVEFSVCHEIFLTPTARWCDVVLPAVTFLEREDIVFPGTNHLLYSSQAVDPVGQARSDFEIFRGLADRLGFLAAFDEGRSAAQWLEHFLQDSEVTDVGEFRRTGIYHGREQHRVGLAEFVRDPRAHPLATASGKIELAPAGYPGAPAARVYGPTPEHPLMLVTPHGRYRVNSQNSNIPFFAEREPQALWIHPQDARARGIGQGEPVIVENERGRVLVPAKVTGEIMAGVVCLLAGAWPELRPDGTEIRGAANMLTSTEPTRPSSGSRTHSVRVQVRAARAERA